MFPCREYMVRSLQWLHSYLNLISKFSAKSQKVRILARLGLLPSRKFRRNFLEGKKGESMRPPAGFPLLFLCQCALVSCVLVSSGTCVPTQNHVTSIQPPRSVFKDSVSPKEPSFLICKLKIQHAFFYLPRLQGHVSPREADAPHPSIHIRYGTLAHAGSPAGPPYRLLTHRCRVPVKTAAHSHSSTRPPGRLL